MKGDLPIGAEVRSSRWRFLLVRPAPALYPSSRFASLLTLDKLSLGDARALGGFVGVSALRGSLHILNSDVRATMRAFSLPWQSSRKRRPQRSACPLSSAAVWSWAAGCASGNRPGPLTNCARHTPSRLRDGLQRISAKLAAANTAAQCQAAPEFGSWGDIYICEDEREASTA